MTGLATFLVGLLTAIGQRIFGPKPPPEKPAPMPEPADFEAIDKRIDEELRRRSRSEIPPPPPSSGGTPTEREPRGGHGR